jgi:hypothetical protein
VIRRERITLSRIIALPTGRELFLGGVAILQDLLEVFVLPTGRLQVECLILDADPQVVQGLLEAIKTLEDWC